MYGGKAEYVAYAYIDDKEYPRHYIYAGGKLAKIEKLRTACLRMVEKLEERINAQKSGMVTKSNAFITGRKLKDDKFDSSAINGLQAETNMKNPGGFTGKGFELKYSRHNQHTPADANETYSNRPK